MSDTQKKKAPAKKAPAKKPVEKPVEKKEDLCLRLSKIQAKLKVPKGRYSTYMECHYRNCDDILSAVKPILAAEGMYLHIQDDIVQIGDRFYVKAEVMLTDGENQIRTRALARESMCKARMDESQTTGSASSYARKYALSALFLIDDEQDSDQQADVVEIPEGYKEKLLHLKEEYAPKVLKQAMKDYGIERLSEIPVQEYDNFVRLCAGLSDSEKDGEL